MKNLPWDERRAVVLGWPCDCRCDRDIRGKARMPNEAMEKT
jgi:hypothetical protein